MTENQNEGQKTEEMTRSQQIASSAFRVLDSTGDKHRSQEELESLTEDATPHDVLLLNKVNRGLTEIQSYMPSRASHFGSVIAGAFRIAADELSVRKLDLAMVIFSTITIFLIGMAHVFAAALDPQMSFAQAFEVIYTSSAQHYETISGALNALGIIVIPLVAIFCLLATAAYFIAAKARREIGKHRLMYVDGNRIRPNWMTISILLANVLSIIFLIQWLNVTGEEAQGGAGIYAVLTLVVIAPSLLFYWRMFTTANNNTLFASYDEIKLEVRSAVRAYKLECEAEDIDPEFVFTKKIGLSEADNVPFFPEEIVVKDED